jgi:hypothetical protein
MKTINFRGIDTIILHTRLYNPKAYKGFKYGYAIRHSDVNWSKPVTVEKFVFCNFWGTLLSKKPLDKFFKPDFITLSKKEAQCFSYS